MKIRNLAVVVIIPFVYTSCATIVNTQHEEVTVHTNRPATISINGDSSKRITEWKTSTIPRSRAPILITATSDTLQKSVVVLSHISPLLYVNLLTYWPCVFVDILGKAKFAYPRDIYLDMNKSDSTYLPFEPLHPEYSSYKNQLSLVVNKFIDPSYPALALSYEHRFTNTFALQGTGYFRLPYFNPEGDFYPNSVSGGGGSLATKFFYDKTAPQGPYVSVEVNYLASRFYSSKTFQPVRTPQDTATFLPEVTDTGSTIKHNLTFILKYGYQKVHKRWVFDFSAGIGIRQRDNRFIDPYGRSENLIVPVRKWFPSFPIVDPGKTWTVTIPINFRIGWTF